jgi:hypothetical protein
MNDEWDPNAYHGGPLRAGDFPLSQRADYKGDAYYARMFKWPRRIFIVAFLVCVGIYVGRHWL